MDTTSTDHTRTKHKDINDALQTFVNNGTSLPTWYIKVLASRYKVSSNNIRTLMRNLEIKENDYDRAPAGRFAE